MRGTVKDELLPKLLDILYMEYGRRNVVVDDDFVRIFHYDCNVTINLYDEALVIYVFMGGEGFYRNFPVDGSKYTLEMLASRTLNGPGSYVNNNGDFFVPNYSFMLRRCDLDDGDFVIAVIDRLVDMSEINSNFFNDLIADKELDASGPDDGCVESEGELDLDFGLEDDDDNVGRSDSTDWNED